MPAYEKLGFQRMEPTKNTDGVLYNPMVLVIAGDPPFLNEGT